MANNQSSIRQRIINAIAKLNLYDDDESTSLIDQIWATRVYIILLIISILIILAFTGTSEQTIVVTVNSPSIDVFEKLSIKYMSTLTCPCSEISISYGQYLTFSPQYHQVCSSEFVSSNWIESLFSYQTSNYYPLDFRLIASSQFQILALLCRMSENAVSDALRQFSSTQIITSNAMFRTTFEAQTAAIVDYIQSTTVADVNRTDRLLSLSISQNRLLSGLRTNFYYRSKAGSNGYAFAADVYPGSFNTSNIQPSPTNTNDSCDCSETFACKFSSVIFNVSKLIVFDETLWPYPLPYFVPGMQSGCIPGTSMRQSTLECFFDQTCLNTVLSLINIQLNKTVLNNTIGLSRFAFNTTIGTIFDNLMIESWNNKSDFNAYYNKCAPKTCTYSYAQRFNLVFMIATIISLIGGLSAAIRISAPILLRYFLQTVRWRSTSKQKNIENNQIKLENERQKQSMRQKFIQVRYKLRNTALTLNVFKKTLNDTSDGIYSTRVYVIVLFISILILTIYSSLIKSTRTTTVKSPSQAEFEKLYEDYSSKLSCPCQHPSMKYSSIMKIKPQYHQICSSVFIRNDGWLQYWPFTQINVSDTSQPSLFGLDFRVTGETFFNLLQTFCNLASETIENALVVFNWSTFVTAQSLGPDDFHTETSTLMNQFTKKVTASFTLLFEQVYSAIRLNQFIIYGSSNAIPNTQQVNNSWFIRFNSKTYQQDNITCSCGSSSTCTRSQGFFCQTIACHSGKALPNQTITGLYLGCYPVDSILLSTLECFYNQSCIQMIIDWRLFDFDAIFLPVNLTNITALDPNLPSQFLPKTKLETIISHLFVEKWTTQDDFDAFYALCQPNSCSYTLIVQDQAALVVTRVIGILGGLTVSLRLLTPYLVQIIRRMYAYYGYYRRRNHSSNEDLSRVPVQSFLSSAWLGLQNLNIYHRQAKKYGQIFATRIYLVMIISAFILISVFVGLQQDTYSFTVYSPTENEFETLLAKYTTSLSCPCSQLATPYEKFLSVEPVMHQICSSPFVSSDWSTSVINKGDIWKAPDWYLLGEHFRLLSSMCQIAQQFLNQSVLDFMSTELVQIQTLSLNTFQEQINTAINAYIKEISSNFRHTIEFILDTLRANQFQDRYMSNWQNIYSNSTYQYIFHTVPVSYNNSTCICAAGMSSCSRSLVFLDSLNQTISFPGFVGGCLPMDGLRLSTLECLFDQVCLNQIVSLINFTNPITVLNSSIPTLYPSSNTSIGSMIDHLFIESWHNSSSYSSYFQNCAPTTCQYSRVERHDFVYIVTYLLGLYGGLTVAFQILVWHGLQLIFMIIARCRRSTAVTPDRATE